MGSIFHRGIRYGGKGQEGNSLGTPINLVNYADGYICPCDGYIYLNQASTNMTLNYINVTSNGQVIAVGQTTLMAMPVKKGMHVKLINGGGTIYAARFYPLV